MKWLRSALVGLGALAIFALAAQGQVPGVNSTLNSVFTLVYDASTSKPTYSATVASFVPSGATHDACTLQGSSTKTIRVRRAFVSGRLGTAVADPVAIVRRNVAVTGLTGATLLTAASYATANPAATAVAEYYTTAPTNLTSGSLVSVIADIPVFFGNLTTTAPVPYIFNFGQLGSPVFLRGTSQTLSINFGGLTFGGSALMDCTWEWTEDSDS